MKIIETTRDLSGAYRVRVQLPDGSTRFFKLWDKPTQVVVDDLVVRMLDAEAKAVIADSAARVKQVLDDFRALPTDIKQPVLDAEKPPSTGTK